MVFGLSPWYTQLDTDVSGTGRQALGDPDGSLIQYPHVSPPMYHSDLDPHQVNTSGPLVHSPNSPTPVDLFINQPAMETTPEYIMELCIVTAKAKMKCRKPADDFKIMKLPVQLSANLTYPEFLKKVVKAANVRVCQLDCEHMHWKFRKLASASPTSIYKDESYSIMVQAVHLKKEADCWIIVEMGKLLLSEAVGLVFFV